jgi:hypothetical protein
MRHVAFQVEPAARRGGAMTARPAMRHVALHVEAAARAAEAT